jgi:hypothetical protein
MKNTKNMYYKTEFDSTTKIWSGPTTLPLYNPNITIGQVVLDTAEKDAAKICQVFCVLLFSR